MNKWIGLKMVKMERNVHLVPMNRVNNSRQGFGFLYICARCWSFSLCPSFYHITPLPSFIFSYVLGLFLCCFFFVGSLACVVRCVCACPFLRRWQRRYTGDCPFPPPPPPVLKDPKAHQNTLKNLRESLVDPWRSWNGSLEDLQFRLRMFQQSRISSRIPHRDPKERLEMRTTCTGSL